MNKKVLKIWNIATTVVVILVVALALLLVGVRFMGFKVYTVLSGSMEPTYQTGSLIYVKETDAAALEVGDVITFMLDENTVATHRIVEVIGAGTADVSYRTKGDANNAADGTPVHNLNVIGEPIFTMPLLGYVANFIQNPPGTYVAIAICAILLILVFVPDIFTEEDAGERRTKRYRRRRRRNDTDTTTEE